MSDHGGHGGEKGGHGGHGGGHEGFVDGLGNLATSLLSFEKVMTDHHAVGGTTEAVAKSGLDMVKADTAPIEEAILGAAAAGDGGHAKHH